MMKDGYIFQECWSWLIVLEATQGHFWGFFEGGRACCLRLMGTVGVGAVVGERGVYRGGRFSIGSWWFPSSPSPYFHPPPPPSKAVSERFLSRLLDKRLFFAPGFGILQINFCPGSEREQIMSIMTSVQWLSMAMLPMHPMLIGHDRAKCSLTVQLLLLIMFMPLLSFSEIAGFIDAFKSCQTTHGHTFKSKRPWDL